MKLPPFSLRLLLCLFPVFLGIQHTSAQANPALPGEVLTPSSFRSLKDTTGAEWNLQQGGVLNRSSGNNSFIGNLMMMMFGQEQFYNSQVFSTAGGEEFVIPGQQQMNGVIDVTRRVRHYPKEGVLRYLDVFTNNSATDSTCYVEWKHNFSNQPKQVLTDKSRAVSGQLDKKEIGIVVYPPNQSSRPLMFCFSTPRAKLKPGVIAQPQQYAAGYGFTVVVPAGKTVSILQTLSQNAAASGAKGADLQKLFRPLELQRYLKDIPVKLRGTIANVDLSGISGGGFVLENALESLGVDRGQQDILASGEVTRLTGRAACEKLTVQSSLGTITIPFDQVAAVVGSRGSGSRRGKVYLRDGQIINGTVTAEKLRFVLVSGAAMELSMDGLDRLVRSAQPTDGQWATTTEALLETHNGDRIALGKTAETPLIAATRWGRLETKFSDISMIHPIDQEANGLWITLKDSSKFTAFLTGSAFRLPTVLFGEKELAPHELRFFQGQRDVAAAGSDSKKNSALKNSPPPEPETEISQPHIRIAGGQRVIGRINLPSLVLSTDNERIELNPENIRSLKNINADDEPLPDSSPLFEVKLWGGGVMQAQLEHGALPILVQGKGWNIPVADIEGYENPVPRIPESMQTKIAELIRNLGNEDWQARDKASKELAEIGYMSKTLLLEAKRMNSDPEVRRRIEQLLSTMD